MKNLMILGIAILMSINIMNAQEISKKQWTLFSKTTADWCTNCGSWGWNMHKQLIEKVGNKETIIWALHRSGGLTNPTATAIASNLGASGQPQFYEGNGDMIVNSSNIAQRITEAELIVELNQFSEPFAGVGANVTLSESGVLTVNAKVEFLSDLPQGDYYLGLYFVEDNVVAFQASQGQNAVHRYLLRRSLLDNTFGTQLISGAVIEGQTFEVNTVVPGISAKRENVKVVAIIWNRRADGKYLFFNANLLDAEQVSSIANIEENIQFNIIETETTLNATISLENVAKTNTVTLYDLQGKIIDQAVFQNTKEMEYQFNNKSSLQTGMYLLTLETEGNKKVTKKVFVR